MMSLTLRPRIQPSSPSRSLHQPAHPAASSQILFPRRPATARRSLVIKAHAGNGKKKPPTGFVGEMRKVAMKLHTKEQAPKEGEREAPKPSPVQQWDVSRDGYMRFLVESKFVYETMEQIVADESQPAYSKFQNTGLERSAALAKDIEWMSQTYGVEVPTVSEDSESAGKEYSRLLKKLAVDDPPAFICHFYNTYFAHSAGGRMIGKKMSAELLDGEELEFYKWDGELSDLLDAVRDSLNVLAEDWTPSEKEVCLEETEKAFKYSGLVMRELFAAGEKATV